MVIGKDENESVRLVLRFWAAGALTPSSPHPAAPNVGQGWRRCASAATPATPRPGFLPTFRFAHVNDRPAGRSFFRLRIRSL